MGGEVIGDGARRWAGAALDSRKVEGGELFFALPGERTDGHRHLGDALARGAAAVVVHQPVDSAEIEPRIQVDDTYRALHDLTRAVRARMPGGIVGVTGSAGKTTTKELLAAMLSRRFQVTRNPGNLNNTYGFPIALLGADEGAEWMVAEMGMSTPGELGVVSRLGRPDVAVYTNVRPVHLEFHGSLEAIGDAKAELLEGLEPDGFAVVNADDEQVVRIANRHLEGGGRVVWYGVEAEAEYRVRDLEWLEAPVVGSRFHFDTPEGSADVRLSLYGRHNVENFLAAATCAHALGVDLDAIVEAAAQARPAGQRGVVHRLAAGVTVLDESYNSNPAACRSALEGALQLRARRRWAVLGDMLELGDDAESFHREVGAAAAGLGFSPVVGVGPLARDLVQGAVDEGAEAIWFEDAAAAVEDLPGLSEGDLVLVKGSRGIGLEVVVTALLRAGGEA